MARLTAQEPGEEVGVSGVQGGGQTPEGPFAWGAASGAGRSGGVRKSGARFQPTMGRPRMGGGREESLSEHSAENGQRGWRLLPLWTRPSVAGVAPRFFCVIVLTASKPIIKWILWLEN